MTSTRTRTCASLAFATAVTGGAALSAALATPVAHADPVLQPIIATVQGDRANTPCPQFNYSGDLEAAAQAYARSENMSDYINVGNYKGTRAGFLGSGDPQDAAINSAYTRGAGNAISNCSFKDFGVGFVRHEDRSVDVVTIVFGEPAAPAPAQPPPPPPPPAQPQQPETTVTPTATVSIATDVYNAPDGNGQPYTNAGQNVAAQPGKVQLVAPELCKSNDWCHIVPPQGAGNPSWIYIGPGENGVRFGTYP